MKKWIVLLWLIAPVLVKAQDAGLLLFGGLNAQTTGKQIVEKFGKPTKKDSSSYGYSYHYDIGLNLSSDFGWAIFYTTKEDIIKSYSVKVGKEERATTAMLDLFKNQFSMNTEYTNLFGLDIKGLTNTFKPMGISFGKAEKSGSKYCWYISYPGSGTMQVSAMFCSGKLVEDKRQDKLYQLDVNF